MILFRILTKSKGVHVLVFLATEQKSCIIDFKTQIQSGEIKSITKAKDLASTLWREHSSTYDNKRAVQLLVDNPGTGHSIKRTQNTISI